MIDSSYLMLYYFVWKKKTNNNVKYNKSITVTNSVDTDTDTDTTEKFFHYHDVYYK